MTRQDRLDCIEFSRLIGENSAKILPILRKYRNFHPELVDVSNKENETRVAIEQFIAYFDRKCREIPD